MSDFNCYLVANEIEDLDQYSFLHSRPDDSLALSVTNGVFSSFSQRLQEWPEARASDVSFVCALNQPDSRISNTIFTFDSKPAQQATEDPKKKLDFSRFSNPEVTLIKAPEVTLLKAVAKKQERGPVLRSVQ
jgi:hypothetical protein